MTKTKTNAGLASDGYKDEQTIKPIDSTRITSCMACNLNQRKVQHIYMIWEHLHDIDITGITGLPISMM